MEQVAATMSSQPSRRAFERGITRAKEDCEWFWTQRIAELDVSGIAYDSDSSPYWDDERVWAAMERQHSLMPAVKRARRISEVLTKLPRALQLTTRARWMSFTGQAQIVASAFTVEQESGSYLGIALGLDSAHQLLHEEQEKALGKLKERQTKAEMRGTVMQQTYAGPRTVLEMLQQWCTASSRGRKVEELCRHAVRMYGHAIHEYAHAALGRREHENGNPVDRVVLEMVSNEDEQRDP